MTPATPPPPPPDMRWLQFTFPAKKLRLPDGTWMLTPGEPQMRCRSEHVTKITGIPIKTLHKLADAGLIRRARLTPNITYWWPAEIEALIERAATDPAWQAALCRRADCKPADLRPIFK